jgi:GTP-binding protein
MVVNVTELKPLTNMRASGSDAKATVKPAKIFSMEMALEFIEDDELVEITPAAVRMRKIWLKESDRKKLARQQS